MGITKRLDAITLNFPIQDLFVNVREHDAGRELGEVGISLDERARIQNDCVFQDVLGHLGGKGSAQLALDLEGVEIEIETDGRKLNPLPQLGAIPENTLAIALGDHDERFLDVAGLGFSFGFNGNLAVTCTLGAIEDVALGHLVIALAHDFLLNEVLHIFNVHKGGVAGTNAVTHPTGDGGGGFGIFLHGKEGSAAGGLDLGFHPGNNRAIATNQANIQRLGLQSQRGYASRADRAFENETLGDIVRVIFDEGFFDEE